MGYAIESTGYLRAGDVFMKRKGAVLEGGGGRYGARTHDLGIANAALSQTELTAHGLKISSDKFTIFLGVFPVFSAPKTTMAFFLAFGSDGNSAQLF